MQPRSRASGLGARGSAGKRGRPAAEEVTWEAQSAGTQPPSQAHPTPASGIPLLHPIPRLWKPALRLPGQAGARRGSSARSASGWESAPGDGRRASARWGREGSTRSLRGWAPRLPRPSPAATTQGAPNRKTQGKKK